MGRLSRVEANLFASNFIFKLLQSVSRVESSYEVSYVTNCARQHI